MSTVYCTIPDYDVSVYSTNDGVVCAMCNFGDYLQMAYKAESTQEMVDHLYAHERKGDVIPSDITLRLFNDNPINYPRSIVE